MAEPASLNRRLLLITAGMLVVAFAGTILALDYVFRRSAEEGARELLEIQVYALIGAAIPDAGGLLSIPEFQLEPRLRQPGSGLYAEIRDGGGALLWRSPSAVGLDLGGGLALTAGEQYFGRRQLDPFAEALVIGLGISWELGPDLSPAFTVFAAEDLEGYRRQLATFRRQLTGWFAGVMLLLLGAHWLVLRAGLAPLRRMEREIGAIADGASESLGERYPRELAGVAAGFNALLGAERRRMQRHRDSLADLAHSLKTPLAVLRTETAAAAPDRATLEGQLLRMQAVIDDQLRRAAASGPRPLGTKPVAVLPVAREIAASLARLHAARTIDCRLQVPAALEYPLEPGDLYELLGNLLENAWKWARGTVTLAAATGAGGELKLSVADDGPGIPATERQRVLARGVRADQRGGQPGQGIGLAVVDEIVRLYGGELAIDEAPGGGARVVVRLPGRQPASAASQP